MASEIIDLGNGFHSIRGSFVFGGMIEIGAQMALIRLSTGKYLLIDTCLIKEPEKARLNEITQNGALIEAVVANHPFHTMHFETYHKAYPNAQFYGTPRHLRNIKTIPWAGSIADEENLKRWESEGVYMRIPAGADFDPVDQNNHFSGVVVYHAPSKTIFNDDTFGFIDSTGCCGRCLLGCFGVPNRTMTFWGLEGLKPTKEAPKEFEAFVEGILRDWDFENACLAHTNNCIGGAKDQLRNCLEKARPALLKLYDSRR